MEDSKGIFCRLCFNIVSNEDFTVIDQSAREQLKTVFSNMEFVNNHQHVMCSSCSVKLYAAFDFKSTCLYVEDRITYYVNPKVSSVNLREVYLNEQNKTVKMEDDQRICRLCLQLAMEGFVAFHEMKLEMINIYIPEMNFDVTEDPVICKQCFESLSAHEMFIRASMDIGMKICDKDDKLVDFELCGTLIERENNEIKLEERKEEIKEEVVKFDKEPDTAEMLIKSEEIDIKCDEEWGSDSFSYDLRNEAIENKMECSFEDVGKTMSKYMHKHETETELSNQKSLLDLSSSKSKIEINNHKEHKTHQLVHKSPLETQMYKYESCGFTTKFKQNLQLHPLTHKYSSEIQMYKCDTCTYETRYKRCMIRHQLTHKVPSGIKKYVCDTCGYATVYKSNLKYHQLRHKVPSGIQMYVCDTCGYTTKHKSNLKSHELKHKDPSEIQMYKCNACTYETKHKHHLKAHQTTHKGLSENHMYECGICPFQSKNKGALKNHQLKHKNSSGIEMYKCDTCDYATKYKSSLKTHELIHKDPSEIQMYKCNTCTYETKYKHYLKVHQTTHKDLSEIPKDKYDICPCQSKSKAGLKNHLSTH